MVRKLLGTCAAGAMVLVSFGAPADALDGEPAASTCEAAEGIYEEVAPDGPLGDRCTIVYPGDFAFEIVPTVHPSGEWIVILAWGAESLVEIHEVVERDGGLEWALVYAEEIGRRNGDFEACFNQRGALVKNGARHPQCRPSVSSN